MPENTTQSTQTTQPTAPAEHQTRNINAEYKDRVVTQPSEGPKLPEKFKDVDSLVAAYNEAEKKITEYGTKYKDYDD